MSTKKMFFPHG